MINIDVKEGKYYKENKLYTGELNGRFLGKEKQVKYYYDYKIKDGLLHGKAIINNGKGNIVSEAMYKNGKFNGKVSDWDGKGNRVSETEFKEGKKHGIQRIYFKNGNLKDEIVFKEDKKIKIEKMFFENNKIKKIINWDGKNEYKEYFISGQLKEEANNYNVKSFYESGKLKSKYKLNDFGKIDGERKKYYENGNLRSVEPFKNGKLHGKEIRYYEDNKIESDIDWNEGKIDGSVLHKNRDNKISYTCEYKNGRKYGKEKFFDIEGRQTNIEYYYLGEKLNKIDYTVWNEIVKPKMEAGDIEIEWESENFPGVIVFKEKQIEKLVKNERMEIFSDKRAQIDGIYGDFDKENNTIIPYPNQYTNMAIKWGETLEEVRKELPVWFTESNIDKMKELPGFFAPQIGADIKELNEYQKEKLINKMFGEEQMIEKKVDMKNTFSFSL